MSACALALGLLVVACEPAVPPGVLPTTTEPPPTSSSTIDPPSTTDPSTTTTTTEPTTTEPSTTEPSTTTTVATTTTTVDPYAPPAYSPATGRRIGMIGSSINFRAAPYVWQYAARDGFSMSAYSSLDGTGWLRAASLAKTNPEVLLIEYGTGYGSVGFAPEFAKIAEEYAGACVVWVSVQDHYQQTDPPDPRIDAFNADERKINELIYSSPHVADWEAEIVKSLDANGYSPLLTDQIHPGNDANAQYLAKFEWDAVLRECGGASGPPPAAASPTR